MGYNEAMRLSEEIIFTDLHHAYVIEAPREEGVAMLRALMEEFGIQTKGNPDFHEYLLDVFLLEHAHVLRREQSLRGSEGAKKIFLVAFNTILSEAQNALLKTLEEPTEGAHFFFVTRTSRVLLPTLLSRMQVVRGRPQITGQKSKEKNEGEEFLYATTFERMNMIEAWVKAKAEKKPKAKEEVRIFLGSLEHALYDVLQKGGNVTRALEHVLSAERILSERSPSLKLLLEHLALTVPKID